MNGTEHYQEAERLLEYATTPPDERDFTARSAELIAAAQVHATLALAAATALRTTDKYIGDSQEITDWGHIVQPDAFGKKPCDDGCVDEGRNGCYPQCVAARAATNDIEVECPF